MASKPISVGSVVVTVIPTTKGIEASLREQLEPPAAKVGGEAGKTVGSKISDGIQDSVPAGVERGGQKAKAPAASVGDEVGKTIGDKIKKPVEDSIPHGVDEGGKKGVAPAADQGSKVGGAFADAFTARVKAATASLPKVTLGADSSETDRKIAQIRAELDELSGKHVGVDIDAADALARMAELREQLQELGRGGDVEVRADAAAAIEELDAVKAQLDRLDGTTARAKVEVSTQDAQRQIQDLAQSLLSVSKFSGIATLGVAAAGIGAGGVAAGFGLGAVGAAALPGLNAVKAAYSAQTQAAQGAAAAGQQVATASITAAQQALSEAGAQQALASAVRQASYAHTQALAQVSSAEQSLATAQQQALAAQKAVNDARTQAAQDLQDLNNQVKDASLAQRANQIALEQATTQLHTVQANPAATQLQRAQAQLAYDQAVQQLSEQGTAYQRLKDQAAAANKAGIDGSAGVTAAQQAQAQATTQLKNAQQQLADARANVAHVDQQSADQVASAQRQILSLQLQQQAAAASAGGAQATAAAKAKAAYDALTPSEQAVYTAAQNLKTGFTGWAQALEPDVLPLFTTGLSAVNLLLPTFTPLVTGAAGALADLEGRALTALGSPLWKKFAGDLGAESGPAITGFGIALGHVATGAEGIIEAFLPYAPRLLTFLDQATGKFSTWGQSLASNSGFNKMAGELIADAPQLVNIVEQIARAAGVLVQDLAPLGGTAISVDGEIVKLVADVASFSPGLVQFGVAVYGANKVLSPMVTGSKLLIGDDGSGIRGIFKAFKTGGDEGSKFGGILVKAKGWLSTAAGAASDAATGGWSAFTGVLSAAGGKASTLGANILGAAKNAGSAVGSGLSAAGTAIATGASAAAEMATNLGATAVGYLATAARATGAAIAVGAQAVATGAASIATGVWTAATAALDAVMDANPIILIGVAIVALVAAIILAYQHCQTFRDVVHDVFHVIGDVVQGAWRDVIKPPLEFFRQAIDAIPSAFDAAVSATKTAFNKIAQVTMVPVNWVIQHVYDDGIAGLWNDVVGAVGLNSLKLPIIPQLKAPQLASGGIAPLGAGPQIVGRARAIVGEGDPRYPEYVIPTDPQYRDRARALHAMAGTRLLAGGGVLGALEGAGSDVVGAATGTAKLVADLITDPRGAWDRLIGGALALTGKITGTSWGRVVAGAPISAAGHLGDYLVGALSAIVGDGSVGRGGSAVAGAVGSLAGTALASRYAPAVGAVLAQLGLPANSANMSGTMIIIGNESGGNPSAVNRSDINWQHGTPSVGLMQVIGPTFKSWAGPYVSTPPQLYGVSTNPVANIYSGVDYAVHRYGSISAVPGVQAVRAGRPYVGYDDGGYLPPGVTTVLNGAATPERVLTQAQWDSLSALAARGAAAGARTTHVAVYPPVASADQVGAEVVRRLQHAGIS